MTEVLYYLSNLTNTPNIFTNSTKARSKRFDTRFHRQVKSSSLCKWLRWEGAFPGEGLLVQIDQVGAWLAHFLTV